MTLSQKNKNKQNKDKEKKARKLSDLNFQVTQWYEKAEFKLRQ
jgi:hypothetical protein